MTTIMTKKEAVELYGSDKCKKHFRKYGKFKNANIENSLIRTLEQYFASVEKVRQGNSYAYELGEKRSEVAEREDYRISNGAWSKQYTKNMDIIVVSGIDSGGLPEASQSLSKWAFDFGLITPAMYSLLPARNDKDVRSHHLDSLWQKKVLHTFNGRVLEDYIAFVKDIIVQLASSLSRLRKLSILDFNSVHKGHMQETDEIVLLHEDTFNEIEKIRSYLMEKHKVNPWYINTFKFAKKVKEYNQEWKTGLAAVEDENGEVLGLDYYYTEYAIHPKQEENPILKYLNVFDKDAVEIFKANENAFLITNKDAYRKNYKDYVIKKAYETEEKMLQPKTKTYKVEDEILQIFYGEEYTETYSIEPENIKGDVDYFMLFNNREYAEQIVKLHEYYTNSSVSN
ncbi:hypothetical protein UM89_13885 [Bacillus subtilis]|nr:hypothetical protein UM89_13885 [Bacillus subtilis]